MKRLISIDTVEELNIMEQLNDYWNITKEQLNLRDKKNCKNCILEYLQFTNVDNTKIKENIDEIVENIFTKNNN